MTTREPSLSREQMAEHFRRLGELHTAQQSVGRQYSVAHPARRREAAMRLLGEASKHLGLGSETSMLTERALNDIQADTGYISFEGDVAVGGYSHLSLFPNGSFSFTGHFHVSGAISYDTAMVWAVRASNGTVFTFSHRGRVHGTFEPGSRDDDWGDAGSNPALAAAWEALSLGYSWRWEAAMNADITSLFGSILPALGTVAAIIPIV